MDSDSSSRQPVVHGAPPRRRPFAASAVAIQAIIINEAEEILLLASHDREPAGAWQVISGGLEAGETLLDGVLREVSEEVGPEVRVRPLGVAHAHTFHYDQNVRYMLSIYYLMAYEGGRVVPGDDMAGSDFRWWRLDELQAPGVHFHASTDNRWLLQRSIELYRLWRDQPARRVDLQSALD